MIKIEEQNLIDKIILKRVNQIIEKYDAEYPGVGKMPTEIMNAMKEEMFAELDKEYGGIAISENYKNKVLDIINKMSNKADEFEDLEESIIAETESLTSVDNKPKRFSLIRDKKPKEITETSKSFSDFIAKHKKTIIVAGVALAVGSFLAANALITSYIVNKNNGPKIPNNLNDIHIVESSELVESKIAEINAAKAADLAAEQDAKMSEFVDTFTTDTIDMIDNLMSKGIEITEEEKETTSKMLTDYHYFVNMRQYDDFTYATLLQEGKIKNSDIFGNNGTYFEVNTLFKKQAISAVVGEEITWENIYTDENDIDLLNTGASLVAKLNSATGSERKEIAKEFLTYATEQIGKDNTYSSEAIDTFITVYLEAFDQLTKDSGYGVDASVSKTLEERLNSNVKECVGEINVENIMDKYSVTKSEALNIIESLESDSLDLPTYKDINRFNIFNYAKEKEDAANLISATYIAEGKSFNSNYSLETIEKNVLNGIDLSNYKAIQDYEKHLYDLAASRAPKSSKDSSGVSDGKGGTISKSQMISNGVNPADPNAKGLNEAAVKAAEAAKSEASTVVTDVNGNVYSSTEELQAAYAAASKAEAEKAAAAAAAAIGNSSTTTYEPVTNGTTTITESPVTVQDYTGAIAPTQNSTTTTNSDGTTTTFVPIDDQSRVTDSYKDTYYAIRELLNSSIFKNNDKISIYDESLEKVLVLKA